MKELIEKLKKICARKVENITEKAAKDLILSVPLLIAEIERLEKENEDLVAKKRFWKGKYADMGETALSIENKWLKQEIKQLQAVREAVERIDWDMVLDVLRNINEKVLAETDCVTPMLVNRLKYEIRELQQALKGKDKDA